MRRVLPTVILLAACAPPGGAQPVAARIAGAELTVSLSDGRTCRFVLPAEGVVDSLPVPGCRGLESVAVHRFDPTATSDILRMFDGEGPLPNDGAPRSVWVSTARGTWRYQG
jgi:hypothetical protein